MHLLPNTQGAGQAGIRHAGSRVAECIPNAKETDGQTNKRKEGRKERGKDRVAT